MRLLIVALILLSVRLCKCEEMIVLDGKLVPRSMIKNAPAEIVERKEPVQNQDRPAEIIIHCTG